VQFHADLTDLIEKGIRHQQTRHVRTGERTDFVMEPRRGACRLSQYYVQVGFETEVAMQVCGAVCVDTSVVLTLAGLPFATLRMYLGGYASIRRVWVPSGCRHCVYLQPCA
jgi:hypothetical protein